MDTKVVNTFADLANLVTDKATGKQIEAAIGNKVGHAAPNPRQAISATGLIAEFAMRRVEKAQSVTVHYVTEQGFRNLFTTVDEPSITFVTMVESAAADDFNYVRDCLRKSVGDMPHNSKKEPNKVPAEVHGQYQAAMSRKSEFCVILGAVKFCELQMRLAEPINGRVYKGKAELLIEARNMLDAKGIDWRGELIALKDQRADERKHKAAVKEAISVATAAVNAGKIDLAQIPDMIGELTQAVKDQAKVELINKKLEGMVERAAKATEGLLKFYDNNVALARKHIEAMLSALPKVEQPA